MKDILERLEALEIRPVAGLELPRHMLFERNGFAALVPREGCGLAGAGAAGKILATGFGVLVWRGGAPFFQTKQETAPARPEDVEQLRRFAADLEAALRSR